MDVVDEKLWDPLPGWLNTASYGLPPRAAWEALQSALDDWRVGRTSWEPWVEATQQAREVFARLIGVDAADVSVGAQVSQVLAPVAAAIPDGTRVLVPENEFASNLFPWMAQADRGVEVTTVPARDLAEVARYTDIVAAARDAGALVVVDATQACGWLPFEPRLADVVAVGTYKWLMSPRGTAFVYLAPQVRDRMRPLAPGWYAGEDVHTSYYGPPLRLARDARRFDISPAWHAWIGTLPALEVVERLGIAAIHDHDVALANRFLAGLGLPPGDSAIVTVDVPGAEERLAAAGVRAAVRAGRVRASFHAYTTEADVDMALDALVD
jgi:selenocysteine lyase/cysteine desulfurase